MLRSATVGSLEMFLVARCRLAFCDLVRFGSEISQWLPVKEWYPSPACLGVLLVGYLSDVLSNFDF